MCRFGSLLAHDRALTWVLRLALSVQMTAAVYEQAWAALGTWVHERVRSGASASIPGLGVVYAPRSVSSNQGAPLKPTLQVSEAFVKAYGCSTGKVRPQVASRSSKGACQREFNATQAALQQSGGIGKTQVTDGVAHLIAELGRRTAAGQQARTRSCPRAHSISYAVLRISIKC